MKTHSNNLKFAFRNLLIQKSIDLHYLSLVSQVSIQLLTEACKDKPLDAKSQFLVLKTLKKYYKINFTKEELFVQLNYD
jgi:hypothetical protein